MVLMCRNTSDAINCCIEVEQFGDLGGLLCYSAMLELFWAGFLNMAIASDAELWAM